MNPDRSVPSTPTIPQESSSPRTTPRPPGGPELRTRYNAFQLHARGGLGEVYLATDVELNRRVALKCLQSDQHDKPGSSERFLREATITAKLEHPGIIPVHGLVNDAAGQPCYAMRFIEGDSLAETIRRFHDDNDKSGQEGSGYYSLRFRQLLQRFVAVCNAVGYAHGQGIVHRDLKPANVMLGPFGETLVVDWGLAKDVTVPQGNGEAVSWTDATTEFKATDNSDQTQMGYALGTPGYMSPEQAAGRWDVLDPRSDIYGLGATLYELLTGRPPFLKDNWPAMQQKIQRGQFDKPRQVRKTIPPALEAICLQAMALEPQDRYQRAVDLGADLDRWLADEPVSCRTESPLEKLRRWTRNHPRAVTGLATMFLVSIVALLTGLYVVNSYNRQLETANANLAGTNTRLKEQKKIAVENFGLALEAAKAQVDALTGELLQTDSPVQREKMRLDAIRRFEEIVRKAAQGAGLDETAVLAHVSLGDVYLYLDLQPSLASKEYERAHLIAKELAAAEPNDVYAQTLLAGSYDRLGDLAVKFGRPEEGRAYYVQALAICEKLADSPPLPLQRTAVICYSKLGRVAANVDEGMECYVKGLNLCKQLVAADPSNNQLQSDLSLFHEGLGDLHLRTGRTAQALASYSEVLDIRKKLHDSDPNSMPVRRDLAISLIKLGDAHRNQQQSGQAVQYYVQAQAFLSKLAEANPIDVRVQRELALTHQRLGFAALVRSEFAEAREHYSKALNINQPIAEKDPANAQAQFDLVIDYYYLGKLDQIAGRYAGAVASFRRVVALLPSAGQLDGQDRTGLQNVEKELPGCELMAKVYPALFDGYAWPMAWGWPCW